MHYIMVFYLGILAYLDWKYREVPVWLLLAGLLFALLYRAWLIRDISIKMLWDCLPGMSLLLLALAHCGVGPGDGAAAVIYGLIYGWRGTILWLSISFLFIGLAGMLCFLIRKNKYQTLPAIPAMLLVQLGRIVCGA